MVISIIGFLATAAMLAFNIARVKARDARRLADMKQIQLALDLYYDNHNRFPSVSGESCCGGFDQGPCGADPFIGALESEELMGAVPTDPSGGSGTGCYGYNYYRYGAGSYGCDSSLGAFYVLGVRDMESSGKPHPKSPGWNCPSRDWQNGFDWVTGKFEK